MDYHNALIEYICLKYTKIDKNEIRLWIPDIDKKIFSRGWTTESLIEENIIVSFFTIFRHMNLRKNMNAEKFKIMFHSILFVVLSNLGPEISYPSKPFIKFDNKELFYENCIYLTNVFHKIIFDLNTDIQFYINEKSILSKFNLNLL